MQNLTCIVCPIGCSLVIKNETSINDLSITGNRCPRGDAYAREEILAPKRTVTATCRIDGEGLAAKRIPVKTVSPCLKEEIPALLDDIYKIKISIPVKTGDIILSNWNGEGIDIVATRSFS